MDILDYIIDDKNSFDDLNNWVNIIKETKTDKIIEQQQKVDLY